MNPANTVIASVIIATGLTALNDIMVHKQPRFAPVIGGFIVGTILLVIAMFSGPIAGMLALLILVTSVLINGTEVLKKASIL